MILFKKDWDDYPDAIVDINTPNRSFVHYSGLLKAMGVENHHWPLQLHNPRLVGVNPRDKNLTLETIAMIALETKNNFFYFLREVMIIPGSDDLETIPFKFNRGMAAMYWLYFTHVVPYIVMIRQTGKSFGMDTLDIWLLNVRLFFANLSLVTKDETLRSANMKRIKDIEETLPAYLKMRHPKDPANSEEYKVSRLRNTLRAHLANKSEKIAANLGRGLTDQHTRFDELAFLYNIAISLPAALAAGGAARERARRRGDPYGTILATTAGKKDDRDGSYAYGLMMESAQWNEKLMDAADEEELHRNVKSMTKSKDELMVFCSFIHTQLGYDDEWLRNRVREAKATGEDAERDFGNRWTSGSLGSPITPNQAEIIRNSEDKEPNLEIDSEFGYGLRWYVNYQNLGMELANRPMVISLDTSDAIGRDDIGLVISDCQTGGTIAAGDFNELNLFDFSRYVAKLMIRLPKSVLIPETKSSARSLIDYLLVRLVEENINPFFRIYNSIVQNAVECPNDFDMIRGNRGLHPEILNKYKKTFGFVTGGSGTMSRNELYGRTLMSYAQYCGRGVRDSRLINQILGLVIRNGRIDHAVSGHDDLCIAGLLGHWFLTTARNTTHYGIPSSMVLTMVDTAKPDSSPQERYRDFVTQQLRQRVEALAKEMEEEPDDFVYAQLEAKLRRLLACMREEEARSFSASDFFDKIRERRSRRNLYG